MKCTKKLAQCNSIRLSHYDYSQAHLYFITLCTYERQCVLGDIAHEEMHLSFAGNIVQSIWTALPKRFPGIKLDNYVIMPNHIHAILDITSMPDGISTCSDPARCFSGLGEVMRAFKADATYHIRSGGMPTFAWQERFYENIIPDEERLAYSRDYIANNPALWEEDSLYMLA